MEVRAPARERQDAVRQAVLARDEGQHVARHLHRVEVVHRREAVLLRDEVRDLGLGDVAEADEGRVEASPVLAPPLLRLVQLLDGDGARRQGQVADSDGHDSHLCSFSATSRKPASSP